MFSRTYRPDTPLTGWVGVAAVLVVTLTTCVQVVPSLDTWMLNAFVFSVAGSPPAWACATSKRLMLRVAPRSTRSQAPDTAEQNLSALPPETLPLTAFSG